MKTWISVLLGSGLCVIAYFMIEMRDRPAAPVGRAHGSPPSKPVRMVAFSGNPLPRAPSPVREIAEDPAVASPGESTEATPAKPAPSPAEVRDGFDAFFQHEPLDPAWSQRTADALTRGIQAVLPAGSRLQRLECRGTLCRIETGHADLDDFHKYTRGAFSHHETRVTTSGVFASLLADPVPGGPVVSVAFLAREGTELPGLEALLATR